MIDAEPAASGIEALKRFDPAWCLFWAKHVRSSQLAIWLPYLRRSRHRYAIMTSEDRIRDADREILRALPNVMIVEPFAEALDWFREVPGFRGFLYIGTQPENFRTVNRLGRKAHVYIGHGESGKGTSGYRTGSLYDAILVAHYHAVSRFPVRHPSMGVGRGLRDRHGARRRRAEGSLGSAPGRSAPSSTRPRGSPCPMPATSPRSMSSGRNWSRCCPS